VERTGNRKERSCWKMVEIGDVTPISQYKTEIMLQGNQNKPLYRNLKI
jgi:hypothetical protein